MSRGPGRMMRAVMDYLHEKAGHRSYDPEWWTSYYFIAWCITRDEWEKREGRNWEGGIWGRDEKLEPSYVLLESVRRAIKTLAKQGRVETTQRWYLERNKRDWRGLHCRLTAQEYERLNVGELPTLSPDAGDVVAALAHALEQTA